MERLIKGKYRYGLMREGKGVKEKRGKGSAGVRGRSEQVSRDCRRPGVIRVAGNEGKGERGYVFIGARGEGRRG